MWYQTIQYIKFLIKSTNQHGVHSPFVFNLITKCFYDNKEYQEYNQLKNYRSALTKNSLVLHVKDLGPGSRKTKSNKRKVLEIAKTSGTTKKRVKLLYRLSKYFQPDKVLELGTSLGIATQALSLGNPNSKITTIEGCPNISEFTKKQLGSFQNINLTTGNFQDVLSNLKDLSFDLVFFDGNHQKTPTLKYFNTLLSGAHNDTIFIFDDIHWSKGMTEAWETIKKHPRVTVSIDTFFWGFVFFRKEQVKEHFTIRL